MKSTQVVAESGYHDTVDVLLVNHVGLPILESFSELGSQVADTQTVLKPAVCRTRKHEVAVPVFYKIKESGSDSARAIIQRIEQRNLYKMLAEIRLDVDAEVLKKSNAVICSEIQKLMGQDVAINGCKGTYSPESIFVIRRHVSFGRDSEDPSKGTVPFYTRSPSGEVTLSDPILVNLKLPNQILDRTLWVCSRTSDKSFNKRAVTAIEKWKEANRLHVEFLN